MSRTVQFLVLPFSVVLALLAADRAAAQGACRNKSGGPAQSQLQLSTLQQQLNNVQGLPQVGLQRPQRSFPQQTTGTGTQQLLNVLLQQQQQLTTLQLQLTTLQQQPLTSTQQQQVTTLLNLVNAQLLQNVSQQQQVLALQTSSSALTTTTSSGK
jgi:hypothetical protein